MNDKKGNTDFVRHWGTEIVGHRGSEIVIDTEGLKLL